MTFRYAIVAAVLVLSACSTLRSKGTIIDNDTSVEPTFVEQPAIDSIETIDSLNQFTIGQAAADSLFYNSHQDEPIEIEGSLDSNVVSNPSMLISEKLKGMGIHIEIPKFESAQTVSVMLPEYRDSTVADFGVNLRLEPSCYPADGHVTSRYGWRNRRMHAGVDIKAYKGDNLYAIFDGVVRLARYNSSYGNYVVIRHYNGLETVYGHASKLLVKVNQEVKAGDVIALAGSTGRSTGSHLHFEVRVSGLYFDPELILDTNNRVVRDTNLYVAVRNGKIYASNDDSAEAREAYILEQQSIKYYTVRSGDVLSRIAANHSTTVAEICRLNKISYTSTLRIGQRLIVRGGISTTAASSKTTAASSIKASTHTATATATAASASGVHIVRSGDTLERIAKANNTTVAELCRLNNISKRSTLQIGQKILLSQGAAPQPTATEVSQKTTTTTMTASTSGVHIVRSGDTLARIAKANNTTVAELCRLNNISERSTLQINQKILLGQGSTSQSLTRVSQTTTTTASTTAKKPASTTSSTAPYIVKSGDTLSRIAKSNNTTVAELCRLNNISSSTVLRIGQQIYLPGSNGGGSTQSTTLHNVRSGDTLSHIAKQYNTTVAELCRLNSLSVNSVLHLNQQLRVR